MNADAGVGADEPEANSVVEKQNQYNGSLSKCSDPNGWVRVNYVESSKESELHPAECDRDDGDDVGAGDDNAAVAAESTALSASPLGMNIDAGAKQSLTPEAGC